MSMHLPAVLEKKAKWYIARCPVLDVYSQGETEEQAKKNLSEALAMFFISCHERGTLDAVLKDCGFLPDYSPNLAKETLDHAGYIDVPLPFLAIWATQSHATHNPCLMESPGMHFLTRWIYFRKTGRISSFIRKTGRASSHSYSNLLRH
jgi:predicted RNase H-like HicB family nuclease